MSRFQYDNGFELDQDGILRDKKDGGINLDDNGILRDDSELPLTPPPTQADSGIEANRHSQEAKLSDPFYSKPYVNDHRGLSLDSHPPDEKSLNISDFDASIKEDLSYFGEIQGGSSRSSSQPPSQANNTQEDDVDKLEVPNGSSSQSQETLNYNWDKKRISLGSVLTNFDDDYPVPNNTQELATQDQTPEDDIKQPDVLSLDVEVPDFPGQGTDFVDQAAERLRVFVEEKPQGVASASPKPVQGLTVVRESPAVRRSPTVQGSPAVRRSPTVQGSPAVRGSPTVQGSPAVRGSPKGDNNNNTKKMAYDQNGANGYSANTYSRDVMDYGLDEVDNVGGAEGYDPDFDEGSVGVRDVPDQVPETGRYSSQGEDMTRPMLRGTMESGFVGSMEMLNTSTEDASRSEPTYELTASHEDYDRDADISEEQVTHPLSEVSFSHSPVQGEQDNTNSSELQLQSDIQAHLDLQLEHDLQSDLEHQDGIEGEPPIPSIYLVGDQGDSDDQYQFKEVDAKSETNTIDMSDQVHDMDDILNEEMPVFTGASIPFTESQDDPASQEKDKTDQPAGDIPHSLIEFEALEVQMRIASQMEKMHEQDEDVFGEFLQKTEQNASNQTLTEHEDARSQRSSGGTGTPIFHTGDSLQFDTLDSSMLNDTYRTGSPRSGKNSGGSTGPGTGNATPSKIPGLKRGSPPHTPRKTSRSSTPQGSRSGTPTRTRIPSPGPSGARPRNPPTSSDVSKSIKKKGLVPADVEKQNYKIRKESNNEKRRQQPVRPEYTVPNLNLADTASLDEFSADSDAEKTKEDLKTRLRTENRKRSQQGEVIEQLQHDYDRLLTKYALAEVTIDQLRLGAKMNLYSDSPTPMQASMMSLPGASQMQTINMATKSHGMRARIASADFVGSGSRPTSQPSYGVSYSNQYTPLSFQDGDFEEPAQFIGDPADISDMDATTGESLKVGLLFQAKSLGDQIESFQMLLEEDELSVEEQERVFEKIRMDYDKLQVDYQQAKDDSVLMKQHNLIDDGSGEPFDNERLIEGELFRLGMKLDNLHGKVEDNLKLAKRRTPFQDLARPLSQLKRGSRGSGLNLPDFTSLGRKGRGVETSSSPVMEDVQDEDLTNPKWQKLQKDYGSLLGLYDRLKKLPKTPERDKDVDALMKKLRHLYNQAPDPSLLNGLPSPQNEGVDGDDSENDLQTSLTKSESTIYPKDTHRSLESLPTHRRDETTPEIEIPTQNLVRGEQLYPLKQQYPPKQQFKQNQQQFKQIKTSPENSGPESQSSGSKRLQAKNARQAPGSHSVTSFPDSYNSNQHETKLHPNYMRPGDTDSGFIGSESSRQSAQQQSIHKQREQQRLNDPKTKLGSYPEDTVASSIPPYIPRSGPPQQQWTDSELSSAPIDCRTRQPPSRSTKRSMSSLTSDAGTRQRTRSSKRGESPHQKRTTPKQVKESATESELETARSVKREKIRQLEETVTQMKEELQRQKQQPVQPQAQPWQMAQHPYPWSDVYRQNQTAPQEMRSSAYPGLYPGYPNAHAEINRPKSFWQDQDQYSEKETQRSSYEESDVPTISEAKERHRPRRRHSFSELDKPHHRGTREDLARPGEQKYIKSESAKRAELRNFHPRERDFDYLKRPKYASDEAVVSKPGRPVRVFASPKDYSRSQERSELDDARNRRISEYMSPKERQRERQEQEYGGHGRQQRDFDRRDASPSRQLPVTDNDTVDYGYGEKYATQAPEAENHYHYLSDLDRDKERIDRMVFEAQKCVQKQEKRRMEKEKKEKKKLPQTTEQVIAPGVVARTLKSPCPACWGEGQQTHTEIQYQSPPQMYGYAPSPVMGQPAYAPSPVMGQPAYAASPVMGQPAYAASPVMGKPAPAYIQPGPVTFTQQISPPQVSYIQPAYGAAVNVPYAQQMAPAQMTSTPAQPAEEKDTSPILKVPLRVYTSDNNVKYYVREYNDGRSTPTRGRSNEKSSSLRRSNSLPRKPRKKLVPLFTDDESIGLTTDRDDHHRHKRGDPRLQNSLSDAVKAAAQLQKLSKKMRNDVKNDLKRSIRSNQEWT